MKTEELTEQHQLIIGQNAKENHEIIKDANPTDIWFHVSDYPSAHIILQPKTKDPKIIYQAAIQAKKNSKTSKFTNVQVIYTSISNVIPTKKEGEVTFKNLKQIKFITV